MVFKTQTLFLKVAFEQEIIMFNEKPAFAGIEHLASVNELSEKAHTVLLHTQRY